MPPLLFIPLVENAFKHGNTGEAGAIIKIEIKADGQRLNCTTVNSFRRTDGDSPRSGKTAKSGGIGLHNLRRRLQLIYGNLASMETYREEDLFKATLSIPLDTNCPVT